MIYYYFLSVLQLLLLQIMVASRQCHDSRNVIQVIGEIKESSQNGYYYGTISTPNFPRPFPTPFNQSWVIDASHHGNGTQINIYLTQMYLRKGVRIFQRPTYEICDGGDQNVVLRKHGPRQVCGTREDQRHEEIFVDKLHNVVRVPTTCPYLEIEVTVPTLYDYHYRTKDPFLFDVYGFNITFEIVPERLGIRSESCFPRNCSNLGHCYLAENWRNFYCDCAKDHPGRFCEVSPRCDPDNNVTFCEHGGKCGLLGTGIGYCDCSETDYHGRKCEHLNSQPKVSARTGISGPNDFPLEDVKQICSLETRKQPCSCRPSPKIGRLVPKDWVKYEARISISSNYTTLRNESTIGYEIEKNISAWLNSTNDSPNLQNLMVRVYSPREVFHPQQLLIHFYGPANVEDKVRFTLGRWLVDRTTLPFRRQIPLLRNTLVIYSMPRVKYKSIEVSKHPKLKIGKTVSLTCTAVTGPSNYISRRDIRFRWFKGDLPVNTSIATRHMTIGQMPTNDNETMSILMIDSVSVFDGGRYTCEITDEYFGDQDCGTKDIEVILPPQIEIEPMSLTLEKQMNERGVVITCTDGSYSSYNPNNKSTEFVWSRSGKELVNDDSSVVVEEIIPQGKLLRILRAEHSESFNCSGFNKEGEERSRIVEVRVLDSKNSPSCAASYERLYRDKSEKKLSWEWTAPNSVAMKPCPNGFIGYVQRPCIVSSHGKVQWGKSDFSRCISESLRDVNITLQNAKRGYGDWQLSSGVRLMAELENYVNSNPVLYPGEGEKIIALLEDVVKYSLSFESGKVNGLFGVFFRTVQKFLKIPNSCVQEKSVLTLCQIIVDMAVRGAMRATAESKSKAPHIVPSDVLMLQTLPISANAKYQDLSYIFPIKEELTNPSLKWLKDKVRVNFPLDSEGLRWDAKSPMMYYLMMAAYKNLSSLLVPNVIPKPTSRSAYTFGEGNRSTKRSSSRPSIELISPVVQIAIPDGYYLPPNSHIKISFNLSKEHRSLDVGSIPAALKGTYYSCGVLDNTTLSTKTDYGRLRWSLNVCTIDVHRHSYVECQCELLGIFGLLKVSYHDDETPRVNNDIPSIIVTGFSFCILSCVLSTVALCIYLKCRISFNTLYTLKLFDCFFIFAAVFIVIFRRTEVPSSSWLVWSTAACSFLISSLSVQVTKVLRVLLMEVKPDLPLPAFVFPWLRNVSQLTLLSAISFSTILPIWTATVAKVVGQGGSDESAFDETSHVFAVFVGTVGLVVAVFLVIYYKAVLKTRRELHGCRQQSSSSTSNSFTAEMISVLTYRMKTLNRSLALTLVLLVMILGIVLHENIRQSVFIQYFLGISTFAMGIAVFLSYVSHCEYPLCARMCARNLSEKPLRRDPERDSRGDANGDRAKLYGNSSEIIGNGSIVGTGLLPPPPPILRNSGRHLTEDSETLSVSTIEEQSMDTFSTEVSFRQHPPSYNKVPQMNNRQHPRSQRSGSNTISSTGSSHRSRKPSRACSGKDMVPDRGICLLNTGEYVWPTAPKNTLTSDRSTVPNNTSISDRSTIATDSSSATSS